jgi:hypothetical protein
MQQTDADNATPYDQLSPKMQCFVDAYISNGYNGAAAARAASYSHPTVAATRLLKRSDIKEAIIEQLAQRSAPVEALVARLSEIAYANIADYLVMREDGDVRFNIRKAVFERKLGSIRKLKWDAQGNFTVELYDALKAINLLTKLRVNPDLHHLPQAPTSTGTPPDAWDAEDELDDFNLQELMSWLEDDKPEPTPKKGENN